MYTQWATRIILLALCVAAFAPADRISANTQEIPTAAPQAGSWVTQSSGTTNRLNSVFFIDLDTGWVVGNNGMILATTNGGATWSPRTSGVSVHLNGVFFVDKLHGWVVGDGGTILRTTNGGTTWVAQNSRTSHHLFEVEFVDLSNGWASGGSSTILVTRNGGATWTAQAPPVGYSFLVTFSMDFVDHNHGWIAPWGGDPNGGVLATVNGGTTWLQQSTDGVYYMTGIKFLNSQEGWAVGYRLSDPYCPIGLGYAARIFHSSAGGSDWQEISKICETSGEIDFVNASLGWLITDDVTTFATSNIYFSEDGGSTWSQQYSAASNLNDIDMLNAQNGWAVGNQGIILRFVHTNGADIGFRPYPDGYGFTNYSGNYPSDAPDFGVEEMRQMFGQQAVCWMTGVSCLVKPSANLWLAAANASMNAGHSDGMASTSLGFYAGLGNPTDFQAGARTYDLTLENVRRHIAYAFVRQLNDPVKLHKELARQATLADILTQLRTRMSGWANDPPTLFIRQEGEGGHTLTPYAIDDQGGGIFEIRVYDSNYPADRNRRVTIDTIQGQWHYDMGGTTWSGDDSTQSLGIVPLSVYSQTPVCPWCESSARHAPNETGFGQVWLSGAGHLLLSDSQNRQLGYLNGQFVDQIPGAYAGIIDHGGGVALEPIYTIPLTDTYTILIDGQLLSQTQPATVTQFGPGYAISVGPINLEPSSQDQCRVSPDGRQLVFRSSGDQQTGFKLALDGANESILFHVDQLDLGANQGITLTIDANAETFKIINSDNLGGAYDLHVLRSSNRGERRFRHSNVALGATDTHILEYTGWDSYGPILLHIDHGSDGAIDETLELTNEFLYLFFPYALFR